MTSDPKDVRYRKHIYGVAIADVHEVLKKDVEYGASWKRRGGIGAFMMLARKFDRLEEQIKRFNYDVFNAIGWEKSNPENKEKILDTLRDLRRYGLLIEAEMLATGNAEMEPVPVPVSSLNGIDFDPGDETPEPTQQFSDLEYITEQAKNVFLNCVQGERHANLHEIGKTLTYSKIHRYNKGEIFSILSDINSRHATPLPAQEIEQIAGSYGR